MAILNVNTDYTGQVGILPRTVKILTTDSYATITAANWIQGAVQMGYNFYPTDVFLISYENNEYGFFKAVFSGNDITLEPNVAQGDVMLPVTAGNLAEFANTEGTISDSGIAAVNVPVYSSLPVVIGNFPRFSTTAGAISDTGIPVTSIQLVTSIKAQVLSWAGGSTSHAFTITGLEAVGVVALTQASAANPETIASFVVTTNTVTITWTGDPGAVVVHCIAFLAPQ